MNFDILVDHDTSSSSSGLGMRFSCYMTHFRVPVRTSTSSALSETVIAAMLDDLSLTTICRALTKIYTYESFRMLVSQRLLERLASKIYPFNYVLLF